MLAHSSMPTSIDQSRAWLPRVLGILALAAAAALMAWDIVPSLFRARVHDILGVLALALTFAYLAHQVILRPGHKDLVKAILLAVAFLFWSADQLWPDSPHATLFNDLAIALFVLDLFLSMIGWPAESPEGLVESKTGEA
jgi:hypothetical protein